MALGTTEKHLSRELAGQASDSGGGPKASGAALAEMTAIRSQMADLRTLLGTCLEPAGTARIHGRSSPECPTVVEHALYLRDLLHAAADRLERLTADARPVHVRLMNCEPVAGYHRWTAEQLLVGVGAEAERLGRLTQELLTTNSVPVAVQQGLQSIAADLLLHVVEDGEEHLRRAEKDVDA